MKKSIIIFFSLFLLIMTSDAFTSNSFGIEHNLNITGQMMGTAGACRTLSDDVESLFYNPAGLSINRWKKEVFLSYLPVWDARSRYLSVGFKYPLKEFALGLAYINSSSGDIITRELSATPTGTTEFQNSLFFLGFSYNLYRNLYAGIKIKAMYQSLYYYNDWGLGCDLGLLLKPDKDRKRPENMISRILQNMSVGLFLKNLIPVSIKLYEQTERAPMELDAGLMYSSFKIWQILIDLMCNVNFVQSSISEVNFGTEINILNWFFVRSGYSIYAGHFGLGLGINFGPTIIDYSFLLTPVDNIYTLDLKVMF